MQEEETRAFAKSKDDFERNKARLRELKMQKWEEKMKVEMKRQLAIATVEQQLKERKAAGLIESYERKNDSLSGVTTYLSRNAEGVEFRYRVSTAGDIAMKTHGVKGQQCKDLLGELVRDIAQEDKSVQSNMKVAHTPEMEETPTPEHRNLTLEMYERERQYNDQREREAVKVSWY